MDYNEKEKLLLEYCLSNRDLFVKTARILKPEYFEKPLNRVVEFVQGYFAEYHTVPENRIIRAETGVKLDSYPVAPEEFNYVCDEIEDHCKRAAIKNAILESADEIADDGNVVNYGMIEDKIRKAISIRLDSNLGLDIFADPKARLTAMMDSIESRSIGWTALDLVLDYIKRGELVLFAAGTGGGKSVTLTNVANNLAKDGLDVLYISLELKQDLVAKRMDSIITGIHTKEIFDRIDEVAEGIYNVKDSYGRIYVKRMPSGTKAVDIRAYLLDYHLQNGKYPDVICVDYLDLMQPNRGSAKDGVFDKDKAISEELREIFIDFNVYGFSASQLNRDAIDVKEKSQSHIAGGLSKLNTSDAAIAVYRNEEHIDNNEVVYQPLKLRNAEMNKQPVTLNWCPRTLRISDGPQKIKVTAPSNTKTRQTINASKAKTGSPQDRLNAVLARSKNK